MPKWATTLLIIIAVGLLGFATYQIQKKQSEATEEEIYSSREAGTDQASETPVTEDPVSPAETRKFDFSPKDEAKTTANQQSQAYVTNIKKEIGQLPDEHKLSEAQQKELDSIIADFEATSKDPNMVGKELEFMAEIESRLRKTLDKEQLKKIGIKN